MDNTAMQAPINGSGAFGTLSRRPATPELTLGEIINIARVCHEANRAYCLGIGDDSQVAWEVAEAWQQESAIAGVQKHLEARAQGRPLHAEDSHNAWMSHKLRDGWRYGPVKDPAKKEHPCLLPYGELPLEEKRKDYLFGVIVTVLTAENL